MAPLRTKDDASLTVSPPVPAGTWDALSVLLLFWMVWCRGRGVVDDVLAKSTNYNGKIWEEVGMSECWDGMFSYQTFRGWFKPSPGFI